MFCFSSLCFDFYIQGIEFSGMSFCLTFGLINYVEQVLEMGHICYSVVLYFTVFRRVLFMSSLCIWAVANFSKWVEKMIWKSLYTKLLFIGWEVMYNFHKTPRGLWYFLDIWRGRRGRVKSPFLFIPVYQSAQILHVFCCCWFHSAFLELTMVNKLNAHISKMLLLPLV